jgi:hypothetical protein
VHRIHDLSNFHPTKNLSSLSNRYACPTSATKRLFRGYHIPQ